MDLLHRLMLGLRQSEPGRPVFACNPPAASAPQRPLLAEASRYEEYPSPVPRRFPGLSEADGSERESRGTSTRTAPGVNRRLPDGMKRPRRRFMGPPPCPKPGRTKIRDLALGATGLAKLRRDGSLYAFWVGKDESGRSDGYLAGGGPGYTGPTDTVSRKALE